MAKKWKEEIEKEVRDNTTIGPLDHNPNKIRRVADQGFKAQKEINNGETSSTPYCGSNGV